MMNLRRTFLYLLDIIFIGSLASVFFILATGGVRIEFVEIDLVSLKNPLLLLATSFLLRKFLYRKVSYKEGCINKILVFLESYPPRKIKVYIFFISLFCFALVSSRILTKQWPTGDEPHYLMITSSLAKDGDINLANNYNNEDYYEFYPGHLIPHPRIHEEDKIYSAHGVGLPVIILSGYILLGRYGASYTICVLFAVLSVILFSLSYQITKSKVIAIGLAFLMSFTIPLVFYSFQLLTESPAAVIVAYLFLACLVYGEKRPSLFKKIFIGLLLAYLPWIHVRYIVFTIVLLIYLYYKIKLREILPIAGIVILSILLLLFYMKTFYGAASLTAQYRGIGAGVSYLANGLLGNFLDCRFGLFLYSPYYMFLGAGLYFFYKDNKKQFLWWFLVVVPFFIGVSSFYHWHGGCSAPLRYITPVVPLFIIPLSYLVKLCKDKFFYMLFFIFVLLGFLTQRLLSENTMLMYNYEYSSSRILDYLKLQGINIEWLFPSLFETTTKDYIMVAVWLVFLILLNYGVIQSFKRRIFLTSKHLPAPAALG